MMATTDKYPQRMFSMQGGLLSKEEGIQVFMEATSMGDKLNTRTKVTTKAMDIILKKVEGAMKKPQLECMLPLVARVVSVMAMMTSLHINSLLSSNMI
jgi:hypothetical protein